MTANAEALRKLKDQATRAVEKRNFARAAALYLEVAEQDPDPDWRQRAGDAFRRAGEPARAVAELARAAAGHARNGFLLKAIAIGKTLLQLEPGHTETQRLLADLYARRDATPAPMPTVLRPERGQPDERVGFEPSTGDVSLLAMAEARDAEPSLSSLGAAAAPLGVLALHRVLGGRRSEHMAVADIAALAGESAPGAYEIELSDDAVEIVVEPQLPRIPLFSSLAADDLHLLIERMTLRELVDDVVVRKGDRGGSLFVVVEGEVRVHDEGRELAMLGPGAFFGELGLLTDDPRSATVQAVGAVWLLEISRELAWEIMRRSPDVLRTMLRFFRARLLDRLISTSPLFAGLAADDARGLADQFVFVELDTGAVVVKEGVRSPGLFLVMAGEVEAQRDGAVLGRLGPGDVFGEMSLLGHGAATADVIARRKTWVLGLTQARFQEIVVTYPQVLEVLSQLSDQRADGAAERTVELP